ncbi:MAG: hypothetical protein EB101_08175, partial [Chitinophagia bacterium]|nr:hypothetical protein [Chitinophagia bacterium]
MADNRSFLLQFVLLFVADRAFAVQKLQDSFADLPAIVRSSLPKTSPPLYYPALTNELVAAPALSSLFTSSSAKASAFRFTLVRSIDSLYKIQLIGEPYHVAVLHKLIQPPTSSSATRIDTSMMASSYFLDALLATAFDLFRGYKVASSIGYDKISLVYRQ